MKLKTNRVRSLYLGLIGIVIAVGNGCSGRFSVVEYNYNFPVIEKRAETLEDSDNNQRRFYQPPVNREKEQEKKYDKDLGYLI